MQETQIKVEDYGLADWIAKVVDLAKQGYTFNFDRNDTVPLRFGDMYTCVMFAPVVEPELSLVTKQEQDQSNVEVEPKVDGRTKQAKVK
jgi:hypothetical protein